VFQLLRGKKGSKGSICSMSSKGWGFSSVDVGVFTNCKGLKRFSGLIV
jgi:hypothetical protein